jgi:acetyl-CoA acetyltransferase
VVGVGCTPLVRRSEQSLAVLCRDAVQAALRDATLTAGEVDGLATHPDAPIVDSAQNDGIDVVSAELMAQLLGRRGALRWYSQNATLIGGSVIDAVNAVASGAVDVCVVWRAMHNPGGRYNAFSAPYASGWRQWDLPYGMHRGYQYFGGTYRRYLHQYGARREHMAAFVVAEREHATRNPCAYWRDQPISTDDYLSSRALADPVHLLDVDLPVDGAAALVFTSAERAKDLPGPAAYVAGYAQSCGSSVIDRGPSGSLGPRLEDIQEVARQTGSQLWAVTGLSPGDVSTVQVYDAYSFFAYWWLEGLGVCREGEAFQFVQDGRTTLEGSLPVNTFGGQLGEGRLHGFGHAAEAVRQAAGRAGSRQVRDCTVSVACMGPPGRGGVAIAFTREPQ